MIVSAGITTDFPVPTEGLVLYLSMDNDTVSGSTVKDQSGVNNHGEMSGPTTGTNGIRYESLSFDGIDDYVTVADDTSLRIEYNLTVSVWTYRTGPGAQNPRIWAKGEWDDGYSFLQDNKYIDGDLSMSFNVCDGNGNEQQIDDSEPIPLNEWTHYVGVYDGNEQRLYRNNQIVATMQWSNTIQRNPDRCAISRGNQGKNQDNFEGRIDELCVYNRALDDSEIERLFKDGQ